MMIGMTDILLFPYVIGSERAHQMSELKNEHELFDCL